MSAALIAGTDPIALTAGDVVVTVHPSAGGRIGQIALGDRQLLKGVEHATGWASWGWYPLAPWTNRIPGGRASHRGVEFRLPVNWPDGSAIHGLTADVPWQVHAVAPAMAELSVVARVDRYYVRVTQRLDVAQDHVRQHLAVENLASWEVPAGLGIHPWFAIAPVRVPAALCWPGDGPLPTGAPRPVTEDEDLRRVRVPPTGFDRCLTGLTSVEAEIGDLRLSWSGPITQVVAFRGEADWVCVEPCTMANDGIGLADRGHTATGVATLAPGQSLAVDYELRWRTDSAATPL